MKTLIILSLLFIAGYSGIAQSNLNKTISVNVNRQKLADVLEIISNKGNFYFSYNSSLVKRDSLVTIQINNKPVKHVLDVIFGDKFEYRESGNYIILRPKPIKVTVVTKPAVTVEKFYAIRGIVNDASTGFRLPDASVYEKDQLIGTLTDSEGFFLIKLRSKLPAAKLTVSKEKYEDTTVVIDPRINQEITVALYPLIENDMVISPEDINLPDSAKMSISIDTMIIPVKTLDSSDIDNKFLGRWFVSSAQKIQSLNLGNWFVSRPFQLSVTPGLSTHGKMSGQVVNHFSLNLLGGYTGGLEGLELGALFNINRKDAGYFQLAGLFNHTGGRQAGFQAAGISNTILGHTHGFQAAGINNYSRLWMHGFQTAGVVNFVGKEVRGMQIAGVYNHAGDSLSGIQIAGVGNFTRRKMKGVQVAGVVNYAYHNKGLQIGLINIADTSDGFSIGLINIVKRGYHKWYIGTDETMHLSTSIKTGNRKLYNILLGGMNLDNNNKLFAFGYGLGTEWIGTHRFSLNTDLTSQLVYLGNFDNLNLLNRFNLNMHFRIRKNFSIYGGPSINMYYSNQALAKPGYAFDIPANGFSRFDMKGNWRGWGGWQAGIALF